MLRDKIEKQFYACNSTVVFILVSNTTVVFRSSVITHFILFYFVHAKTRLWTHIVDGPKKNTVGFISPSRFAQ